MERKIVLQAADGFHVAQTLVIGPAFRQKDVKGLRHFRVLPEGGQLFHRKGRACKQEAELVGRFVFPAHPVIGHGGQALRFTVQSIGIAQPEHKDDPLDLALLQQIADQLAVIVSVRSVVEHVIEAAAVIPLQRFRQIGCGRGRSDYKRIVFAGPLGNIAHLAAARIERLRIGIPLQRRGLKNAEGIDEPIAQDADDADQQQRADDSQKPFFTTQAGSPQTFS